MYKDLQGTTDSECFYLETDFKNTRNASIWLEKCMLVLVERGSASLALGDKVYEVDKRSVLLIRPGLSIQLMKTPSHDFKAAVMVFPVQMIHGEALRVKPNFVLLLFTRILWQPNPEHRKLIEHFRWLFRFSVAKYGQGFSRELVAALLSGMIYGAHEMWSPTQDDADTQVSSRSQELFLKFIRTLHENYQSQHEVKFYADTLCISSKYLTQITRNLMGRTPKQIIDERIMHEALRLLDMNNSSIQEISMQLGFPDQSYFGRFFKRNKKIAPQQYRLKRD